MREKRGTFRPAHVPGMLLASGAVPVKFQEPQHPVAIRLLGAQAVVFDTQDFAHLVHQFGQGEDDQNPSAPLPTKAAFSSPNTC
jgi:hypothetical protein